MLSYSTKLIFPFHVSNARLCKWYVSDASVHLHSSRYIDKNCLINYQSTSQNRVINPIKNQLRWRENNKERKSDWKTWKNRFDIDLFGDSTIPHFNLAEKKTETKNENREEKSLWKFMFLLWRMDGFSLLDEQTVKTLTYSSHLTECLN